MSSHSYGRKSKHHWSQILNPYCQLVTFGRNLRCQLTSGCSTQHAYPPGLRVCQEY